MLVHRLFVIAAAIAFILISLFRVSLRGFNPPLKLRLLLMWLMGKTADAAQSLFWTIMFNLAFAVDLSDAVQTSTSDPLDAPVLMGPKGKVKTISRNQKHKIAAMASRAVVFKSGQSVVKGMNLVGKKLLASAKSANRWVCPLAFQYLHRLQVAFDFNKALVPIFSVAWDATRLSKMDVLATTIYNPHLRVAAWCPPQVICDLDFGYVAVAHLLIWVNDRMR